MAVSLLCTLPTELHLEICPYLPFYDIYAFRLTNLSGVRIVDVREPSRGISHAALGAAEQRVLHSKTYLYPKDSASLN